MMMNKSLEGSDEENHELSEQNNFPIKVSNQGQLTGGLGAKGKGHVRSS